jgi:sugar lactone lactonase YvrE
VYIAAFLTGVLVFDRQTASGPDYGRLTQKPGAAGCINHDGSNGCTLGRAVYSANDIEVSPDGISVYVAEVGEISVFDRDTSGGPSNGTLTQKPGTTGCVGTETGCGAAHDLNAFTIALSRDGTSLYSGSNYKSVAVFDRSPDGIIQQKAAQLGCVSEDGSGGACADGKALQEPGSIVVSPDGSSVYVGSRMSRAIAIFDRDQSGLATNGAITQRAGTQGCITEDGTDGDYVEGACAIGRQVGSASIVAISPDNRSVYSASNGIAIFDRDVAAGPNRGVLTQKPGIDGCIAEGRGCTRVRAIKADSMALSPDSTSLYITAIPSGIAILSRDTSGTATHGRLSQKTGPAGCWTKDGTAGYSEIVCRTVVGMNGAEPGVTGGVAVSPTGRSVYLVSGGPGIAVFARRVERPLPCWMAAPTMRGTDGDDDIKGTPGDDIVMGLDGNDTIYGFGGSDVLCGDAGRDSLKGGEGKDVLDGGLGKDDCTGGPQADTTKSC